MRLKFLVCVVVASSRMVWAADAERTLFVVSCSLRSYGAPVVEVAPQPAADVDAVLTSSRRIELPVELATQRYELMNDRPLLVVPEPQFEPGGLYGVLKGKVFDPITTPEIIKVGKVHMTGGVVGAVKKKNPFYLLNPLVFAMDW